MYGRTITDTKARKPKFWPQLSSPPPPHPCRSLSPHLQRGAAINQASAVCLGENTTTALRARAKDENMYFLVGCVLELSHAMNKPPPRPTFID